MRKPCREVRARLVLEPGLRGVADLCALGSMRQTFQIMARADNLQSLDPQDCSGLAQRLLQSMEDFANLGAALPDGTVFCSASPGQTRVSVTDRNWFQEAQSGEGITSGEFVTGRISGKPGMVFGYPVRDADGTLKAVLFASIQSGWFDKLIADARTSFDGTARDAALAKLHARIVEEAPFVWVAHDVGPRAMSAKVKGVVQPKSWFIDLAPMSME